MAREKDGVRHCGQYVLSCRAEISHYLQIKGTAQAHSREEWPRVLVQRAQRIWEFKIIKFINSDIPVTCHTPFQLWPCLGVAGLTEVNLLCSSDSILIRSWAYSDFLVCLLQMMTVSLYATKEAQWLSHLALVND